MLALSPLLTLVLSALLVNAAPTTSQVTCVPKASGPFTLYRYRQVPQGLEISETEKNSAGLRMVDSSDAGQPGNVVTFFECRTSLKSYGVTPVNDGETQYSFGQLRTRSGRCITAVKPQNQDLHLVAKPCPTADGEAQRPVTFQLIKSKRNGLKYDNKNYKLVLATATQQEQQQGTTWDFNRRAVVYGSSPRGEFGSSLRLRHAQDL